MDVDREGPGKGSWLFGKEYKGCREGEASVCLGSLTESGRDELMEIANKHGLSASAFVGPAARGYVAAHGHIVERMEKT